MRTPRLFLRMTLGGLAPLIAIAVGLSPAAAVVPVIGTPPTITPVAINNSPGDQTDPHVSGDWAAYAADVAIRYYNFTTGADAQIPLGGSVSDLLSDVSGSRVVFSRVFKGIRTGVMVFDAATAAAPIELDPNPGSQRWGSAIGANTVAYVDYGLDVSGAGELVIHDLVSSLGIRITFDAASDQNPSVSPDGNVVVWEKCASSLNDCDIYQAVKGGGTWTVSATSNTANPEGNPDTNGSLVVYDSNRSGNSDIFWRPVAGGPEVQLQLPGSEHNPSIAGNFIAFESSVPSVTRNDLFVYDIVANKLYQITNTPLANEQLNDMTLLPDGRLRLVWASDEELVSHNIWGATFTLPSAICAPPTIAVSVSPSVLWPPNNKLVNIHATVTVSSVCDPHPTFVLTSITSSCSGKQEDQKPDIVGAALGTPDLDFQLRAGKCREASGAGERQCERTCNLISGWRAREQCREKCEHPDRVYTVTYTATDNAGRSASASATVTVPHDKQGHGEVEHGHGDGAVSLDAPGVVVSIRTVAQNTGSPEGDPGDVVDQELGAPRSAPGILFDARSVDPSQIYLGTSSILVAPTETRFADVNGDGHDDLVLRYTGPEYQALLMAPVAVDDSITLYYRTADGTGYEVQHLIAAGVPIDAAPIAGAAGAAQYTPAGNGPKPSNTELAGVYPNPVRGDANVVFTLAHDERVDLAVYDVRGARVRTLERGSLTAGRYQVSWNGRADDGRGLTRGMYFVRLTAGRYSKTVKTSIMP